MLSLPPLSLYIHIPWCIKKCPYCDFNSYATTLEVPEEIYIEQLIADLIHDLRYVGSRRIETIFIGGGTPSLFSAVTIHKLLQQIKNLVLLSPQIEITMEANPGAVESLNFTDYQLAGINRLSIGVQSFNQNSLNYLGRIHDSHTAKQSIKSAMQSGFNSVNIDLMFGLPYQELLEAISDLRYAIDLQPDHISWYQLTIEPNTLFDKINPPLPNDEQLWHIWQQGKHVLKTAGYQRYEISAYGKPAHYAQHNLNYWRFGDYIGIGCGAHGKISFEDGRIIRTVKTSHPKYYLKGNHQKKEENVPLKQRPVEFFMNRWRLLEPTPRGDFLNFTGVAEKTIRPQLDILIERGYLHETRNYWQLTHQGRLFLNSLLEYFI